MQVSINCRFFLFLKSSWHLVVDVARAMYQSDQLQSKVFVVVVLTLYSVKLS